MRSIEKYEYCNVSGGYADSVPQTIDFIDDGKGNIVPRWTIDGPIELIIAEGIFISAYIINKYFGEKQVLYI